jgi:hypothetical protein
MLWLGYSLSVTLQGSCQKLCPHYGDVKNWQNLQKEEPVGKSCKGLSSAVGVPAPSW